MTRSAIPSCRGFNPDPSIVRVGDDYYIATSTFEWFPGVQIHHSRDLVHWRLLTRPLRRASQLNMLGDPDSCGVWAPCLTLRRRPVLADLHRREALRPHHGRRRVGRVAARLPQLPRHQPDASTASGPIPVYLNSSGFDPSLFHDDDGRKYLRQHALGPSARAATASPASCCRSTRSQERRLIGERVNIFKGTPLGFTEAPHLYKRDGYYYLLTAEGGTGWGHAVTMARSRTLDRAVRAASRHLHPERAASARRARCSAPATPTWSRRRTARPTWSTSAAGRCATAAAARSAARPRSRRWSGASDGWLRTRGRAGAARRSSRRRPTLPAHPFPAAPVREDFDAPQLPIDFQWLRTPWPEELFSLTARPGHLRLFGRETIGSLFRQALVARRQQAHCYSAVDRRSSSSRSTSSRWPASSATTTAPSSTTSTSRTTRRSASTCA